jgi:adenylate cyclase class IV
MKGGFVEIEIGDQIYDSIRQYDKDICDIAKNLDLKADNIKNVKDPIF